MKTFIDSGVPLPIQLAVVETLSACDAWLDLARIRYVEYQRQFRAALRGLPIELFPTEASMFCWARIPGVPGQLVAEACAEEAVVLIQGDSFAPAGADCFRMTANLAAGPRLDEMRARLARVCERLA
jgi:aspartate/methionine/tyrosine aminotransferase